MNMLRKVATSIFASNTQCGCRPTLLRIAVAIDLAMKCLLRAPAIAKPPNSNIMTCSIIFFFLFCFFQCRFYIQIGSFSFIPFAEWRSLMLDGMLAPIDHDVAVDLQLGIL